MAKRMNIEMPHSFDHDEARARIEALGDYFSNKYGVNVDWNGDQASIKAKYMMVKVDGTLDVGADKVDLEGPDPGRLLRKKARNYLEKKLRKYLDPATSVEDLPRS